MIKSDLAALADEISAWFAVQKSTGIPDEAMYEAYMMIPLMQWLAKNNFGDFSTEYWERESKDENIPYHAFDLKARRANDTYLFDLKFMRPNRIFNCSILEHDFKFLSLPEIKSKYRYSLVSGVEGRFSDEDRSIRSQIQTFLAVDIRKHITIDPQNVIIRRHRGYLTMVFDISAR